MYHDEFHAELRNHSHMLGLSCHYHHTQDLRKTNPIETSQRL